MMRATRSSFCALYLVALWALFSKFKLVRWSWLSGTISLPIGGFILATFLALFNYLTPSGRVMVSGRVVEVTPNVTGQIVAITVKPNVPVKAKDVLFQIDPAPFQYRGAQLQASLAGATQQVAIVSNDWWGRSMDEVPRICIARHQTEV
jgi:multidrug resistance efflux pump